MAFSLWAEVGLGFEMSLNIVKIFSDDYDELLLINDAKYYSWHAPGSGLRDKFAINNKFSPDGH